MMTPSPKQAELVFIETLRERANKVLRRAHQASWQAFVEVAVRDLTQAAAFLNVEDSPVLRRAASKLTDLACDRIEMTEKALSEGPQRRPAS
jgi:hypothetical protein